jgi:integrase
MAGLTPQNSIFGNKAETESKSSPEGEVGSSPLCPRCHSKRVWRASRRFTADGFDIQRWFCRDCKMRFSDPNDIRRAKEAARVVETVDTQSLKSKVGIVSTCQICVTETKNLGAELKTTEVLRRNEAEVKGKILEHAFWMQKEGYAESTITRRIRLLRTIANKGANLQDPESVKETLAKQQKWQTKTKKIAVETYSLFLKMQGKTWSPPKYLSTRRLPFIPLEREIDDLIAGCNPKTATFLRMLKETGARLGEAWQLQWIDIDFENKTVNITPEKGSNPRKLKLTDKLLSMLNNLPKTQPQIFIGSQRHFVRGFRRQRKKIALKLENDRITKISCHTFRHWKATTEIARHRTIKEVQYMLGHRSLLSTDYYVQLVTFESDDYTSANARTIQEAQKLVEAGFEYVCDFDGDKLFRKRK